MNQVVQLHSGNASARLVPAAGGRVSALRLARPDGITVDVLYPYPEDFFDPIRWAKGGIYPLMPYSNRIANAVVQVQGEAIGLRPHPDAAPHSLHGNAHALAWQLVESDADSAVMALDSPACAAWPWHYTGSMHIELSPNQLLVQIDLRNADTRVMPGGLGLHPYFLHEPHARVAYGASARWSTTPEFLAQATRPPRADEAYASARPLPDGGLTDYLGGWDGIASVDLPASAAGARSRLTIQADPLFSHLVVHRPDNMAYLCLEPVSHVADAFNLAARGVADTGARLLAPGQNLGGTIRFQLTGDAA
jgi:aldose 1-epimerase